MNEQHSEVGQVIQTVYLSEWFSIKGQPALLSTASSMFTSGTPSTAPSDAQGAGGISSKGYELTSFLWHLINCRCEPTGNIQDKNINYKC